MRILLVDDDTLLVNVLTKSLNARNYSVDAVGDGAQAWNYLSTIEYDVIILDVLLPKIDGVSLCRRLRAENNDTPVLILTAQQHSQAKVRGLDAGADDYLAKPFDIEELMARIRALLRRRGGDLFPVLQFGGVLLDPAQCSASYEGLPLALSTKEYALMELFLHNPEHVFSIADILDSLWSSDEYPAEATVRSHIRRLRRRLIEAGAPKDFIANVHGRGYFLKVQTDCSTHSDQAKLIDERQFTLQRWFQTSAEAQYQSFLEETWQQFQPKAYNYFQTLKYSIQQLELGKITLEEAETAHLLAHKLAGTLGLFHQEQAMEAAQSLESFFDRLSQCLKEGCYGKVRSLGLASSEYLDPARLCQPMNIIQTALSTLSSPLSQACPVSPCLLVLNLQSELTQALKIASQNLSLLLLSIEHLDELSQMSSHDSIERPSGLILPLTDELMVPNAIESLLSTMTQLNWAPTVIGIGKQISFEARLHAVRSGVTYILDQSHSPESLLQQAFQLTYPFAHQTRALLVDDDETWLRVMTQQLKSFGFAATGLSQPEHFWATLESCQPDVVILDIKMPKVNGLELCQVLRSHPDWHSVPVILLSMVSDFAAQSDGFEAGADDFLSKQLRIDDITRRILNRLSRRTGMLKGLDLIPLATKDSISL